LHRLPRQAPEIHDAIAGVSCDQFGKRAIPDDSQSAVELRPCLKYDIDAFLVAQPAHEQSSILPHGIEGWRPRNAVRLDDHALGRDPGVGKYLLGPVRQDDEAVDLARPGARPFVKLDHRGDRQRRSRRIPIDSLRDCPPAGTSQVSISDHFGGMEQGARREDTEIVQGHDGRHAGVQACVQDGGAQQRKEIVDVNDVRLELHDFPGQLTPCAGAVDHLNRRGNPSSRTSDVVVADRKQLNVNSVLLEHRQLFANDAVLSSSCLIEVVDQQNSHRLFPGAVVPTVNPLWS